MKYIPTIGLEIHAELKTKSKMFCSCPNNPFVDESNSNVCPICLGHPGTLPVPNEEAIRMMVKVGLALGGEVAEHSKFDRKNYFYPDLPKGYQISQYDMPLVEHGKLKIGERDIEITRVHLEEDTGSSQHPPNTDYSLVNFNRAGVPLMELVTEPVIQSGEEARKFGQEFQLILRYLNASDADMEKGQMRVEANVSVRPEGEKELGTKVEVKNLNSFRAVERSIAYEIERQTRILENGEKVVQETRGWNENKGETFSQREKEEAHDYRYFPEPDIPPLHITKAQIDETRAEIPELPQQKRERFEKEYTLPNKQIEILVSNKDLGEYFEQVMSEVAVRSSDKKLAVQTANYLTSDLRGLLQGMSVENENFKITAENFAELMNIIAEGKVSTPAAKAVLHDMFNTGSDPSRVIEEQGLTQVADESKIERIAKEIIEANPKAVDDYKAGKEESLKFLVGQMMAKTRGAVNPETAQTILQQLLTSN